MSEAPDDRMLPGMAETQASYTYDPRATPRIYRAAIRRRIDGAAIWKCWDAHATPTEARECAQREWRRRGPGTAGPGELLDQNADRLLRELRDKMRRYEARYEIASSRVEDEVASGHLRETSEVCDWLIVLRTYRLLEDEQQARATPPSERAGEGG